MPDQVFLGGFVGLKSKLLRVQDKRLVVQTFVCRDIGVCLNTRENSVQWHHKADQQVLILGRWCCQVQQLFSEQLSILSMVHGKLRFFGRFFVEEIKWIWLHTLHLWYFQLLTTSLLLCVCVTHFKKLLSAFIYHDYCHHTLTCQTATLLMGRNKEVAQTQISLLIAGILSHIFANIDSTVPLKEWKEFSFKETKKSWHLIGYN